MERLRRYSRQMYPISHSFAEALVTILLLPLLLPCGIYLNHEQKQIAKELEKWKEEATPGVHLTCIPYSRNCTRGPKVQAAMGRAFAGMGYPSTWKDAQDSDGNRILKKNKNGEILHNRDGTIRYQQVPAQQGIIDWIEDQKGWIQSEMKRRYDWDREYKGSHSRGNLSTPDYQAARAKERQEEYERMLQSSLTQYEEKVHDLSLSLDNKVDDFFREAETQNMIDHYLTLCSDEEYEAIAKRAADYLDQLAVLENEKRHGNLIEQIRAAEKQQGTVVDSHKLTNHQR